MAAEGTVRFRAQVVACISNFAEAVAQTAYFNNKQAIIVIIMDFEVITTSFHNFIKGIVVTSNNFTALVIASIMVIAYTPFKDIAQIKCFKSSIIKVITVVILFLTTLTG